MDMQFKSFEVKADATDGEGTFSGYASTWSRDEVDDVVLKGAFADTLANDYGGTGAGIPVYWNHAYDSPMNLVGQSLSAVEDEKGLLFEGRIDTSTAEGARVYELLKSGLVHQMSIGFIPEEGRIVTPDDAKSPFDVYREISKLKLMEVSVVTAAANQEAEITEVKRGRAISAANEERIRAAYDALGELLGSLDQKPDGGEEPKPGSDDGDATASETDAGGDGADNPGDGAGDESRRHAPAAKSAARASRAAEFEAIADWFGGTD